MAQRRFPRPDTDFAAFMQAYAEAVRAWWDAQGLDDKELQPFEAALQEWDEAFPAHVAAQAAAQAATQAKDQARVMLEARARRITAFIQSYPATTNADRATIGITIRDAGTRSGIAPASKPLIVVEDAGRRTHALRLIDEATPTRKARPRGVERAEVFVAFTPTNEPAPADPAAYRYVQSVSDGKAVLSFDAPQGGMQAHYVARWVTRRGAIGPWSDAASATVAA